jgi:uncharacterized protein YndB with AHSA1/START domain
MIGHFQSDFKENLNMERTLNALPERVFSAWTNPKFLKQWWGPSGSTVILADLDVRIGGRYRIGIRHANQDVYYVGGTYHVIQPHTKLAFTWRWENPEMDMGESLVTIQLEAQGLQKTKLQLTHAQLPSPEAIAHHQQGWVQILESLAGFTEN